MHVEQSDPYRALLNEAERLLRSDPSACLDLLNEVELPDSWRGRELWLRGQALMSLRRPDEALPVFEQALVRAQEEDDILEMARLHYAVSGVFFMRHEYDEALTRARLALDTYARGPEHPPTFGKIIIGLGHIQYIQGHFDLALDYYGRAVSIFDELRDLYTLGSLYSGMAGAYEAKGELEAALRYAKLRVSTFEAIGDARGAAEGLAMLAQCYRSVGDQNRALTVALDAVRRAEGLGSSYHEATARGALASICLLLGDLSRADREARSVLRLSTSDGDLARSEAIVTLAEIAEQQGRTEETDSLYLGHLEALPATGNTGRLAEVALAYSRLLEQRGDTGSAARFARLAAEARGVPGAA